MEQILILEDDSALSRGIALALQSDALSFVRCPTLAEGLRHVSGLRAYRAAQFGEHCQQYRSRAAGIFPFTENGVERRVLGC